MVEKNNIENSIIVLLAENKIMELLDVILDRKIEGEIYKEDFDTINQIIQDFFLQKKKFDENFEYKFIEVNREIEALYNELTYLSELRVDYYELEDISIEQILYRLTDGDISKIEMV